MEKEVRDLFATILQLTPDEINDDSTPKTVKTWDSLNHLNLIVAFEEEFSIDIEPEEIKGMMESFKKFKSIILQKTG